MTFSEFRMASLKKTWNPVEHLLEGNVRFDYIAIFFANIDDSQHRFSQQNCDSTYSLIISAARLATLFR